MQRSNPLGTRILQRYTRRSLACRSFSSSPVQRKDFRLTTDPSPISNIQSLVHCRVVASLSYFYHYYFGFTSSDLASPLPFVMTFLAFRWSIIFIKFVALNVELLYFSPPFSDYKALEHLSFFRFPNGLQSFCFQKQSPKAESFNVLRTHLS